MENMHVIIRLGRYNNFNYAINTDALNEEEQELFAKTLPLFDKISLHEVRAETADEVVVSRDPWGNYIYIPSKPIKQTV